MTLTKSRLSSDADVTCFLQGHFRPSRFLPIESLFPPTFAATCSSSSENRCAFRCRITIEGISVDSDRDLFPTRRSNRVHSTRAVSLGFRVSVFCGDNVAHKYSWTSWIAVAPSPTADATASGSVRPRQRTLPACSFPRISPVTGGMFTYPLSRGMYNVPTVNKFGCCGQAVWAAPLELCMRGMSS